MLAGGPPPGYRGAMPLGLHLEGPFLSPLAAGAHDPAALRAADPSLAAAWTPANGVRLVTLAPELDGALELIAQLARAGVVVSAGHSAATYEQGAAAIEAGVRYATHLLNAMPPLDKRTPGLAGALLEDGRVTIGVIPDGIHLHPAVLRLVDRACGRARLSAVTDATAALGMPAGTYTLAGGPVVLDGTSVRRPDGRLAGSALTADEALRRLAALTGRGPADALAAMTEVPARLLGISSERGTLAAGARADLLLLDARLEVVATFVGGEEVHGAWR
jgi:N-acetylglucosamine-6-phosphate deacetylase